MAHCWMHFLSTNKEVDSSPCLCRGLFISEPIVNRDVNELISAQNTRGRDKREILRTSLCTNHRGLSIMRLACTAHNVDDRWITKRITLSRGKV